MADDILSVGIDIGTSTTQVIFSRLSIENTSGFFSVPHVSIVDKNVIYKSQVYATPLKSPALIDGDAVRDLAAREFARAGFTPADTQTGAVIITGETARKDNASLVLERLSGFAGDFVVSTAGPDLESIIAGKGSGAKEYSETNGCAAANVDIGGGTANIVLFDCGEVISTGCLDIGGRLVCFSADGEITYISGSVKKIAAWYGLGLHEGERINQEVLERLGDAMNQLLEQALGVRDQEAILREVQTPGSSWLTVEKTPEAIFFSGGVAEAVYREPKDLFQYGDIGPILGRAVSRGKLARAQLLKEPLETIHATVVGAGTYTTTISGSTITYTKNIFPIKNVPVLKLTDKEQKACFQGEVSLLEERMRWSVQQNDSEQVALAMKGKPNPGYQEIRQLAGVIREAAERVFRPETPLIIIVECDMAKALGQAVYHAGGCSREVIALDSIRVDDSDFVDMGSPLMGGLVVPVVVKTLIFG